MIKVILLVFLSLVAVLTGTVIAYMIWMVTPIFDPLWRASFAVLSWMAGFALGTKTFWKAVTRMQLRGLPL